ncbi:hypothetical protein LTR95_016245 [Oleoguttula sp. CCFEE 5521]
MPFTINGLDIKSLPQYQYILWPDLVWPRGQATRDAIDALDRQIRDIVGPGITVERQTGCMDTMLILWLVKEPSDEHALLSEKQDGIAKIQMDGIDESISYD